MIRRVVEVTAEGRGFVSAREDWQRSGTEGAGVTFIDT